jgi:glycosyltransferase involved in cell wall biosynthesis
MKTIETGGVIRRLPKVEPAAGAVSATPGLRARRLRVLHVGKFYPPHMGGIETHVQALCTELRKTVDLRVIVASADRNAVEETVDGVEVSRVPAVFTLSSAPLCPGMVAKIRNSDADIVHIHLPNPTAVLAYLASRVRARLVVSYHSDTVRQRFLGAMFEPCLHIALRRSSAIIASSPDYQRTSLVLNRYRDRCCVIPYGIALEEFESCDPAAANALRRQYGDRVVLSVGRLVYYKGFEYLIRAMDKVRGKLVIVGDGPLRAKLHNLSAALGLGDRVIFAGSIPDKLVPYYHSADVFALASVARSEAFGIVQIEAMAAGLPVVNTSLDSGVPFVSLHEQTGLTVPPADADQLAAALNRLLDNESLRRSLGARARLRARQEFSLEAMTSRTSALYDSVMSCPRPAQLLTR